MSGDQRVAEPRDEKSGGAGESEGEAQARRQEELRMWSAIAFSIIILGAGIPLWWKTTEVYRVDLPYSEIEELQALPPRVAVNVTLLTRDPAGTSRRVVELAKGFESSELFEVLLSPAKLEAAESVATLEEKDKQTNPGSFKIVEMKSLPNGSVVLGNHRSLYFHPEAETETILHVMRKWVFREDYLKELVASLEQPGGRAGQQRRLKSEPCFDLVLTTVNPEPDRLTVVFDAESSAKQVIEPLLEQLRPVADLTVKSQWLYFVDIGAEPKKNPDGKGSVIAFDRIPHIISPLEKKLGSGVSSCPCLHFVLYVPKCSEAPLSFASADGEPQTAVVSPRWGGIQIHNPAEDGCKQNGTVNLDVASVAKVFVTHLRYLLDLHYPQIPEAKMLTLTAAPLRGWEVDSLYRSRVLEQAISARLTLQSLSRLLGEISNIVINEEVGDAIQTSVRSIDSTFRLLLPPGDLREALVTARQAFITAEMAFGHPSLLALLYFPDDQKYAVYIPLFLPVMIPVILSLKNTWKWLKQ